MEDVESDPIIDSQPTTVLNVDDDISVENQGSNPKPPPICFIARINSHYGELCAKLDTISREYFIQFAGEKTLVYFKYMRNYNL
ncbi:hypothetical protein QE152_g1947 [Popillia japonica]|uniref:Uncharacterized protein n=1 Tax=Popillia japonica TaxID=7064 RepID=A0AAW1N791_POPJA